MCHCGHVQVPQQVPAEAEAVPEACLAGAQRDQGTPGGSAHPAPAELELRVRGTFCLAAFRQVAQTWHRNTIHIWETKHDSQMPGVDNPSLDVNHQEGISPRMMHLQKWIHPPQASVSHAWCPKRGLYFGAQCRELPKMQVHCCMTLCRYSLTWWKPHTQVVVCVQKCEAGPE